MMNTDVEGSNMWLKGSLCVGEGQVSAQNRKHGTGAGTLLVQSIQPLPNTVPMSGHCAVRVEVASVYNTEPLWISGVLAPNTLAGIGVGKDKQR